MRSIYTLEKSGKMMPDYIKNIVWHPVKQILSLPNGVPASGCIIYLCPSNRRPSYFYLVKKIGTRGSRPVHFKITPIVDKLVELLNEFAPDAKIINFIQSQSSMVIAQVACNPQSEYGQDNCIIRLLKGQSVDFETVLSEFNKILVEMDFKIPKEVMINVR